MRLFTAVSLDTGAYHSLAGVVDSAAALSGGPRWTDRALWHLTLVFLGEVDQRRLPRLRGELAGAAVDLAPFTVRLAGAGTFPPNGRPQVLWIGVGDGADRLVGLARAVRRAARRARLETERRRYHPHLTLGRWRNADPVNPRVVDELDGYAGPDFAVDRFALFRSHPTTDPGAQPRHEVLETWPLPPR